MQSNLIRRESTGKAPASSHILHVLRWKKEGLMCVVLKVAIWWRLRGISSYFAKKKKIHVKRSQIFSSASACFLVHDDPYIILNTTN